MCISLRPTSYVMGSNVNLGSFGVTGVKSLLYLKCYNSSMLHSMTIRFIHVHQLGPSTYVIGSYTNLGSFGVSGVKRSFSLKCYTLSMTLHDHIYSNFNISISFKPSITFAGSTGNQGLVRGRSLKAGRIRRLWRQQCLVNFAGM